MDDKQPRDLRSGIPIRELTDGAMVSGVVDGEDAVVLRAGDDLYAVGGQCTHYHARLCEGLLTGTVLRCPMHHARFDVSLHKLTGMGPDGNLREMLKRLRVLDELEPVFPDTLFRACAGDTRITLTKDPHAVLEALQQRFPDCAAGLQTIFDEISTYGYDGYMQFRTLSGEYEPDLKRLRYAHTALKTRTTRDAIRERVPSPTLREILALPCIYVGAFPEQTSYLYFLHVWYAVLFGGSAYLRGGSSALTVALVRRIERGGERVVTRAEVQQIAIDRTSMRATGVVTEIGHFHADEVIVNTSPIGKTRVVVGSGSTHAETRSSANNVGITPSTCEATSRSGEASSRPGTWTSR